LLNVWRFRILLAATWKERLDHTDECVKIYKDTIDVKTSDLTVRQVGLVDACKTLAIYPPGK
jgi:hypothetical protein